MLTLTADSMALRHQNCLGLSFLRQRGRYFVSVKNSDFAQKSNEESSKPSAPCPNWTRKPGKTNTVKFRKQAPGLIFFKCTVFALFYFVYEGNFQVQAPVGLKCGDAYMYIWRGLFSEFYGTWLRTPKCTSTLLHGSKTWTPTRDSIGASLAPTSGRDHLTNSEVLARAGILSIHPFFSHGRLRRLGHVYHMDDGRVPRKFYTDYRQQHSGTSSAPLCDSAVHGRLRVISKLAQLTQTIRKIDRGLAGDGQ